MKEYPPLYEVVAEWDELHEGAVPGARAETLLGLGDLRAEAVDAVDHRDDVALGGDDVAQRLVDQVFQGFAQRAVEGVGHREHELAVGVAHGQHHVAPGVGARERLRDEIVVDLE